MRNPSARAVVAIVAVLALANFAIWPSLQSLWAFWMKSHDYSHGPLIALLAVAWMARIALRDGLDDVRFSWAGTVLLGALLFAWLITLRANLDIAHQLLWPLILAATLFATLGGAVARRFMAPLVMLYFAIPVWNYALPVLLRLSIFFSENMLAVLGVPTTISENQVTIPEGTFAIVEGCSGKHYLVVTLAIAWLAAAMNDITGWRRAVFMLISAALSMFTNWVRIVTVIYAGHVSDMQHYLVANEHLTFGYGLFIPLLAGVLLLARRLASRWAVIPEPPSPAIGEGFRMSDFSARALLPAGLLLATLASAFQGQSVRSVAMGTLPLAAGRWQGPLPARASWMPVYVAADAQVRAAYVAANDESIELYANLYEKQENGRELIHYGNNISNPVGWTQDWSAVTGSLRARSETLSTIGVRDPGGQRWVLAYLYRVGSGNYRTDVLAKLAYGWRSLGGQTPAGIVAIAARCDARNCDEANMLVADFWEYMEPELLALVPAGVSDPQ